MEERHPNTGKQSNTLQKSNIEKKKEDMILAEEKKNSPSEVSTSHMTVNI